LLRRRAPGVLEKIQKEARKWDASLPYEPRLFHGTRLFLLDEEHVDAEFVDCVRILEREKARLASFEGHVVWLYGASFTREDVQLVDAQELKTDAEIRRIVLDREAVKIVDVHSVNHELEKVKAV